ncbi:30S ribosomal protein S9 [Mycoplasma haemocanis str. Illinois]|uniref:Small ribosomal subunit protein uS9 n=1 Tax=Mycoplasma haemocanis (strain Illinois) TaxID=1111676 RepID=H6N7U2_MYCHN|nr:30S ribosomal protein S9 [Mycoplasma haemocanis]AEW45714.1 30S ribosomal protein S9 [Mycoplasma haemocanis str. Illinois]
MSASKSYFGFGSRKEAVAKVRLLSGGSGNIEVKVGNVRKNSVREVKEYFKSDFLIQDFMYPLSLTNNDKKFDLVVNVRGGGISAQAGAIRLGIARALLESDFAVKQALKSYGLLTQNRKYKERKKIGKRGARRSPQFTKR